MHHQFPVQGIEEILAGIGKDSALPEQGFPCIGIEGLEGFIRGKSPPVVSIEITAGLAAEYRSWPSRSFFEAAVGLAQFAMQIVLWRSRNMLRMLLTRLRVSRFASTR